MFSLVSRKFLAMRNIVLYSVCWFLGKNISNFVPPAWKLDNLYYHSIEWHIWKFPSCLLHQSVKQSIKYSIRRTTMGPNCKNLPRIKLKIRKIDHPCNCNSLKHEHEWMKWPDTEICESAETRWNLLGKFREITSTTSELIFGRFETFVRAEGEESSTSEESWVLIVFWVESNWNFPVLAPVLPHSIRSVSTVTLESQHNGGD